MADLPAHPDSNGDTDDEDGRTPRWVKVCGIIGIVVVLVFVVLHLTGHGLGGHMPVREHGMQQR
jgi:hypothetical protein